ncbi:MAG: YkgJ family cysteine cluster protein [Candidatus Bathyarchaeota archaeon]|nr:YkgJ family cysteine cluster protein [Candidatus Bathyarchaeota archaeon]
MRNVRRTQITNPQSLEILKIRCVHVLSELSFREVRRSLTSGIPCVKHKCIKCCLETNMPLSNNDLNRILKLGYELECVAEKTQGRWRLKNNSGKCVFLLEKGCRIYSHRPEGCRLYPVVYDETSKRMVIDPLCPYGHLFRIGRNDVERLKILLGKLAWSET